MKVRLRDVVDQLDAQFGATIYFLKNTGEFVPVTEELEQALDRDPEDLPQWERELLPEVREALESEHSVPLPNEFDIHEWNIMQEFSEAQSDPEVCDRLLNAIHGRGAFRMFRAEVSYLGIETPWYEFRKKAFERIAIEWLEENEIPYER